MECCIICFGGIFDIKLKFCRYWSSCQCKCLWHKKTTKTSGAQLSVLLTWCVYLIIQFCNLIYGVGTHISSNFVLKLPKLEWSSSKLTRSYTSLRQEPLCLTCILNIASSHLLQMTFSPNHISPHMHQTEMILPSFFKMHPLLDWLWRDRERERENTVHSTLKKSSLIPVVDHAMQLAFA